MTNTTPPPKLDLRSICYGADQIETTILIWNGYERSEWMRLGCIDIQPPNSGLDNWRLKMPLGFDATTASHDSVALVSMTLTGLAFEMCWAGVTCVNARIIGDDPDTFRVPTSEDYNPAKDAVICAECATSHPMVDDSLGWTKPNYNLYKLVRGRRIEIRYGAPKSKTP